jgi:predicted secreted hydrolase
LLEQMSTPPCVLCKARETMRNPALGDLIIASITWLFVIWPHTSLANQEGSASEWQQAVQQRTWTFPRDHGSHPEYQTEWWYFTGNLQSALGNRFGYQLTFFRQGVRRKVADPDNPWSLRDLYLAQFAITDISAGSFQAADLISRPGPGLASAATDNMDVWVLNWSARLTENTIHLEARNRDMAILLELRPEKPPVLHGHGGLSKKGPGRGQASYYYSYTSLETTGHLRTQPGGGEVAVSGISWFDHEFGSNQLASDQEGWDWFSLHLSDGRDLMIYLLRRTDGSTEPASSGTLVDPVGQSNHLEVTDMQINVLDRWRSATSGSQYPSRWRIQIPKARIDLTVAPLLPGQELDTQGSTGIVYWEGAVSGEGTSDERKVSCEGYIELTGYAEGIGGVF